MDYISSKKIVFLLSSFRAGGGEKQMVDIANTFANNGYNVDLLVIKPVGEYKTEVSEKVTVISLDKGRIILSLPPLIAYFRTIKPQVVVALDEYTHLLALLGRMISRTDMKVILRIGNMLSILFTRYRGLKNIPLPYLVKYFYKKADLVIANSHGVAQDIATVCQISNNKITIINNPKDLEKIQSLMLEEPGHVWFEKKTLPIVLAVGRLREQKNFPLLIRAFAEVIKVVPSRLVIVGAGREEMSLRDLVRNLDLSQAVSFPGYNINPYMYMSRADVLVLPSLWEGLPNTVIESLICGLPVIASDCNSGPREILAPTTDYRHHLSSGLEFSDYGVLCAVNDQQAFVEAITKILQDTTLRTTYQNKSLERAKDFEMQKTIGQYEKVVLN